MKLRALFPWLLMGAVAIGLAQTTPVQPKVIGDKEALTADQKTEVLNAVNKLMAETVFVPGVDFNKWPEYLAANRAEIDKAETSMDFAIATNKALRQFGISHMVLATPQAASNRRNRRAMGMGIQIEVEANGIRVQGVFPKSGADEAGIQPGDLIMENNGKPVKQPTDLTGTEGESSLLTVQRGEKKLKIRVTRKAYSNVRPETLTWVDKETAVLKVWTFDLAYNRENVEKLMLEAAKSKRLIVDLRSNPGGAVLNLTHLMGMLMPSGTPVGAFLSRSDVDRYVKDTGGKPTDWEAIGKQSRNTLTARTNPRVPAYKGQLAVLVNGGSGSASEIAAIALSEQGIPVVGSKSAGAVLASLMRPIALGFQLQYPIMDYVSPKGVRLEGTGVQPLLESTKLPKFGEKDEAIEKATLLLIRMARDANRGK